MLIRLILKVTKIQFPPNNRLGTADKNILGGGHHAPPPPMSNRVKEMSEFGWYFFVPDVTAHASVQIISIGK